MFKCKNIKLKKEKEVFSIVTKKKEVPRLHFYFKEFDNVTHVEVVKVGMANIDEYLTREELLYLMQEIEKTHKNHTISLDFIMTWNKTSQEMIHSVLKELGYLHITHFQNMVFNGLCGKNNGTNFVKIKHEKYKKIILDQNRRDMAFEEISKKFPMFEYSELNYRLDRQGILYYIEGVKNELFISYNEKIDSYVYQIEDSDKKNNGDDIYEIITTFFQKEYESNRLKNIYKPPTHHFNSAFGEQSDGVKKRIYGLLNKHLSSQEIENFIAMNKNNITKNKIGKLQILTIGGYYLFLQKGKDKLFPPEKEKEIKKYYDHLMKEMSKELWKKIQKEKLEKAQN